MNSRKKRTFDIIQIGYAGDIPSKAFDIVITLAILANLFIAIFDTFEQADPYKDILHIVELITVVGFTVEYVLRVWTAEYLYPNAGKFESKIKYILSFGGIIDLLSFLPTYLPVFFPAGAVAFRMFRVIRILRLFRVNAYYDAFNVIVDVIKRKKDQIFSSVFIIVLLIIASSLCMYSLEHEAQPEVFKDAFSGIWWSVSTLLTVGYGDIYPITTAGQVFSIVITFLGVGMVAIPTGILSAGFVEYYGMLKNSADTLIENDMRFIKVLLDNDHIWTGKKVKELGLPKHVLVAGIMRKGETVIPKGELVLCEGDCVVIAAEECRMDVDIDLKQLELRKRHPWVGHTVKELDISRHTLVVMVRRKDNSFIPTGDTMLCEGDVLFLFSKKFIADSQTITV